MHPYKWFVKIYYPRIIIYHLGPFHWGKLLETGDGAAPSGKIGLLRLQKNQQCDTAAATLTVSYPPRTKSPCQGDHDVPHSKWPSWSPYIQPHPNHLCSRTWTSLPGTICKDPVLPAIFLPRHHPPLEQSSPDSCKLYNHRQLQEGSTTTHSPIDSQVFLPFYQHYT
jgi:hypothetical protein